jgi:hypothetical protein
MNPMDEDDAIEGHKFPEGQEPTILTGTSEFCHDGKHQDCIGHGTHEGQTIFCVCPCHEVPHKA